MIQILRKHCLLKKNRIVKKIPWNGVFDMMRTLCIKLPQLIGFVKCFESDDKSNNTTTNNYMHRNFWCKIFPITGTFGASHIARFLLDWYFSYKIWYFSYPGRLLFYMCKLKTKSINRLLKILLDIRWSGSQFARFLITNSRKKKKKEESKKKINQ